METRGIEPGPPSCNVAAKPPSSVAEHERGARSRASFPLVLVHGGGQAAQNLMQLACSLSNEFTVYVSDRRGRGSSGPPGDQTGLTTESQDLDALLVHTCSEFVFGLS
jgi:pimeloyl-ACP methyl ester carboxylesterase